VAHHHNQRNLQLGDGEFEAAQRRGAQGIAGVADNEQLAQAPLEQKFGRHAQIEQLR
jgi:hypothetical protein